MPILGRARLEAAAGRPPALSAAGRFRIVVRGLAIVAVMIPSVALHYTWRLVGRRSLWPRRFLGATGWIAGARVTRHGIPRGRNTLYVSNHVSWIDILAIAGTSGAAFVAKTEIGQSPIVGWLSTLNDTVFVKREDRLGVAAQVDRLRAALARVNGLTIFPAGTTDDGRSLLPFKAALLAVLEPPIPGVMVQPIVLDYRMVGFDIGWLGKESGAANAWRVLARPGRFALDVHFLPPFDPAPVGGRKAIAVESHARIAAALSSLIGRPVQRFVGHDAWAAAADALGDKTHWDGATTAL